MEEQKLSPQRLKELMELEWNKKGVEYTNRLTRWVEGNGCIWPQSGREVKCQSRKQRIQQSTIKERKINSSSTSMQEQEEWNTN